MPDRHQIVYSKITLGSKLRSKNLETGGSPNVTAELDDLEAPIRLIIKRVGILIKNGVSR